MKDFEMIRRATIGMFALAAAGHAQADDSLSATRSYVYDANQRLCMRVDPEAGATVIQYDGAGNVLWTASGQPVPSPLVCNRSAVPTADRTVTTYDDRNRIKTVNVAKSTDDPTYEYYPDGALKSLTNGIARWDYTYNLRRLPVEEKLTIDLPTPLVRAITHAYNANGFESSLTYPSGSVVAFTPDALGRPTKAGSYATAVQYYPNGGMRCFNYGNKVVHRMVQNARRFPDRSQDLLVSALDPLDCNNPAGGTAVVDDSYDYDFNGNVAAITDGVVGGGGSRDMSYDGLDRLVNTNAPAQAWINAATSYDGLDNIRSNKVGSRIWNYAYDANNRLDAITTPTGTLVRDIVQDARGNVTTNGAATYAFDYSNRMTAATGKETFLYDGYGRRVAQTSTADGKAIYPMYSQAGQLLAESNQRDGKVTEYVYLNTSLVAKRSQPVAGGTWTTTWEHTDALGSPVAETDAAGGVTNLQKYTPYGEPSNGFKQGPGFTGHVTDAMTGLSYMQQRYYDPTLGRFLAVDPVEPSEKDGSNFGRYWYANNNPYRFTDPDGRLAADNGPLVSCNDTHTCMTFEQIDAGIHEDARELVGTVAATAAIGATGGLADAGVLAGAGAALDSVEATIGQVANQAMVSAQSAIESGVSAVTSAAQNIHAAILASPAAVKTVDRIVDFVGGYLPGGNPPPSGAGYLGAGVSALETEADDAQAQLDAQKRP